MRCEKCGVSVMKTPLHRVNEKGVDGIWWCMSCIEGEEPELSKNIKEEETEIERILKKAFGIK